MFFKVFFIGSMVLLFGHPSEDSGMYHKEYYETGRPKAEGWLKNGLKTGYWRFYHPNGKVAEKGHYAFGKRENYWYFYTEKGALQQAGHYKKDAKADWWLFYDDYGNINHKCQLNKGKKNGYCLRYKNSKLTAAEKYQNGKKIKSWYSLRSFKKENSLSDLR